MTKPAKLKFTIYRGATFRKRLRWSAYPYPVKRVGGVIIKEATGLPADPADRVPIDLTGCSARLLFLSEYGSTTPLLELTSAGTGIVLGGSAGTLDFYVADEDTELLTWDSSVLDLKVTHPNGEVTQLAYGSSPVLQGG